MKPFSLPRANRSRSWFRMRLELSFLAGILLLRTAPAFAAVCTDPQPTMHFDDFTVHQTPALPEPSAHMSFRDPTFGTCLVRLTDRDEDIDPSDSSQGLKNEYSRVQSFNSNETLLLIMGLAATWYLYDAQTLCKIELLPFSGSVEPRWDANDPHKLYYVENAALYSYLTDIQTTQLIHDFRPDFPDQELAAVWSRYEGSPSYDGSLFGFMAEDEGWNPTTFLIYEIATDRIIASLDVRGLPNIDSTDSVTISPLGDYFVASLDPCPYGALGTFENPCGLMVYDSTLQSARGLHRNSGHCDLMVDAQGREIMAFQDNDTDYISMLDLDSGAVTPLWRIDFSENPGLGLHLSGRASGLPGWALVTTHDESIGSSTWMDDGVFAIETRTGGRIVRLAHTHSLVDPGMTQDYWAEPHGSSNRDMTRILFTTNWGRSGTELVETFMIELPAGWSGSPQPTPTVTPITLGVRIELTTVLVHPGELFGVAGFLDNPGPEPLTHVPTFFVLGVFDEYFFWPSWSRYAPPQDITIDYNFRDAPIGTTPIEVLSPFIWPNTGSEHIDNLVFYGAMLDEHLTTVIGSMAVVNWAYGAEE